MQTDDDAKMIIDEQSSLKNLKVGDDNLYIYLVNYCNFKKIEQM